jgi:hypothetical protein
MTRRSLDAATAWWFSSTRRMLLLPFTLALLGVALLVSAAQAPLRTDYVAMLTGARVLTQGGCLYCHTVQLATQQSLVHATGIALDPFLEAPVVAEMFRPLLGLPPLAGFLLETVVSLLIVAAACVLVLRALKLRVDAQVAGVAAVAALSLPVAWVLALGQSDAVVMLAAALALWLRSNDRRLLAGVALSVAFLKPQAIFMALPLLLVAREWRWLLGTAAGIAALAIASWWIAGGGVLSEWLALVASSGPALSSSVGVGGAIAWIGGGTAGLTASALTAASGVGFVAWKPKLLREPSLLLACAIVLSLLAAPHVYSYDLAMLLLPVLVLARHDRSAAAAFAVAVSAAELFDSYLIWSGVHAETLLMCLLVVALVRTSRITRHAGVAHASLPIPVATA